MPPHPIIAWSCGGVVLEWQGELPSGGEVAPLLLELVDRGIIRILDIALLTKDPDGSVTGIQAGELPPMAAAFAAFAAFQGASSGLLGYQDLQGAAAALEPGTAACVALVGSAPGVDGGAAH